MKRALLILCSLLMIVSFVFVGCKGAVNPENPDDTEQSSGSSNNPSGSGGGSVLSCVGSWGRVLK